MSPQDTAASGEGMSLPRIGLIAVAVAAACLLLYTYVNGPTTTVKDGTLAFSLPDLEGNIVSLSDERFQGKVVFIDVWGTWCPPCRKQIPELVRLHEKYADAGLEIIGIDFEMYTSGDPVKLREGIASFTEELGVNYLVLLGGETADVLTVMPALENFTGFPTSILIGRDGLVKDVRVGYFAGESVDMEQYIAKLLQEVS